METVNSAEHGRVDAWLRSSFTSGPTRRERLRFSSSSPGGRRHWRPMASSIRLPDCDQAGHHGLSDALGFGRGRRPRTRADDDQVVFVWQALHHEIDRSGVGTVFLSSEYFMLDGSVEAVRALLAPHEDVRIVVYLRRHDHWWVSGYNQRVKTVSNPPWQRGFERTFAFRNERTLSTGRYRYLVDRWSAVFGKANMLIRPYEQQQNRPDIVTDLLRTIGFDAVALRLGRKPRWTNPSLPFLSLSLVDVYQRARIDRAIRDRLIEHALSLSESEPETPIVSPAVRRRLVEENLDDYRYIAREYLDRADGRLFYEAAPRSPGTVDGSSATVEHEDCRGDSQGVAGPARRQSLKDYCVRMSPVA